LISACKTIAGRSLAKINKRSGDQEEHERIQLALVVTSRWSDAANIDDHVPAATRFARPAVRPARRRDRSVTSAFSAS
jgi:hypothetical protein